MLFLLYFDAHPRWLFYLFSSLLSSQMLRAFVTQGFFQTLFWQVTAEFTFAIMEPGQCFWQVTGEFKFAIIEPGSMVLIPTIWIIMRGPNLYVVAWKTSTTAESFCYSRSNFNQVWVALLAFLSRILKVIINKSWSLPVFALGKLYVLRVLTQTEVFPYQHVINQAIMISIWVVSSQSSW